MVLKLGETAKSIARSLEFEFTYRWLAMKKENKDDAETFGSERRQHPRLKLIMELNIFLFDFIFIR